MVDSWLRASLLEDLSKVVLKSLLFIYQGAVGSL